MWSVPYVLFLFLSKHLSRKESKSKTRKPKSTSPNTYVQEITAFRAPDNNHYFYFNFQFVKKDHGDMVDAVGAILSAFLQVLFDRIARQEVIDFFRGNHLDEALLEKLMMLLLSVTTVLSDAEDKQFIDPLVKEWVDKLQNAAYDADDLLDEISTKTLQDKMDSGLHTTLNQVRDYASSLNPFAERIKSKVNRIIERLKTIIEYKDLLGLKEGSMVKSLQLSSPTTSLVDEHEVYGRDGDREKIIEFLLSGNANGSVPVVAIVGMGGVGKTTLAQILYNDARVRSQFQLRSWASVSDTSNVHEMTKKVFESFTLRYSNITDLNVLQLKLKDRVARQRFLLVLDGFWNENFLDWEALRRPFKSGDSRSRIIVTTRSQSIASTIRADLTHSLSLLSHEDCWKLFSSHAFKSGHDDEHPDDFTEIGQKIVRKCDGLPLAAKALGSLLHSKGDVEEWKNLLNSKIWELPNDKSNILPALRLSYSHLPSHLKRCFTYCSIFPKGYEIRKWNLIHLWMAEGILPQPKSEKRIEDVGDECFLELLSRSFFQQSNHQESCVVMHDLVNDLAQFVAGEFCYKLEDDIPCKITMKARHLSYLQGVYDAPEKFETFSELQQLRTFLPFKFSNLGHYSSITSMVSVLLPKLKRLRVLSLSHYPITKLPDSIGNSKHLRYLDLSFTAIAKLPNSITSLYNLETLMVAGCRRLTVLPTNMFSLVNLRHLDVSGSSLIEMPAQFGRLKVLQVLTKFFVSKDRGESISELGELLHLRGALSIVNLQNVTNAIDAYNAQLEHKKYLHELEFEWTTATHDVQGETVVLDMLKPHVNAKRLKIENFGGDRLPNWLGSHSFSSMVRLHLANCRNCPLLPSLGQLPSLRELYITKMTGIQKVGPEFYGNVIVPFRSLIILNFEDMSYWEDWSPSEHHQGKEFPTLQELQIRRCPQLTGKLPENLPCLDQLVISACQVLEDSVSWVPRLRELELTGCDAFVYLPEKMIQGNTCLQTVAIRNCSSLVTISGGGLPSTLRSLDIYECRNLELFPDQHLQGQLHYPSLERLHLKYCCNSLISFPLSFFTKLEDLCLQDCNNIQFISNAPESLPYLRKLKLKGCSKLVFFPEGGLPAPNLESLSISRCTDLSPHTAWGLEIMASLVSLNISGLIGFASLEHTGIQCLTSLKILKIKACKSLESLPLEALATSLSHLTIRACPLLQQRCKRDNGDYWNLISCIPSRVIED